MRFFSVFALACAVLQAASALPVSNPPNDHIACGDLYAISSRDPELLEARAKFHQHQGSKKYVPPSERITFVKGDGRHFPDNHLNRLDLYSKDRTKVEKWHKDFVAKHMKTIENAHSAKIVNLAHGIGSRDSHIHISAKFMDKGGNVIKTPQAGNGLMSDIAHVYINKKHPDKAYAALPLEYKKAIDRNAKIEGRPHDVGKA